jgi:outer membrane protein assembly factor BamD
LGRTIQLATGLLGLLLLATATAGCAGKKGAAEVEGFVGPYTPEEAYRRGLQLIQDHDLNKATRILSNIDYYGAENRQQLEPLVRMATADATFYQGTALALIDARSLYRDFVTLYGDHPLAPYAQFQAGMCILAQVTHPSKDQSHTFEAIADLELVERRWPSSVYARAARSMIDVAQTNLAKHEVFVGRFYLKRKKYLAAAERFRTVLNDYPAYTDLETVYFYLGRSLVSSNNPAEGRVYLDKLVADFPEGRYTEEAKTLLTEVGGQLELDLSP